MILLQEEETEKGRSKMVKMSKKLSSQNENRGGKALRNSNFELLRILAIIFIVADHFSGYGDFSYDIADFSLNRFYIQFLEFGGKLGVCIFVLISGYFLVNSEKVKISKVIKLWLQILSYSITFYLLFVIFGKETFSIKELIKSMLPITGSYWWFATTYFVLYLISPFLNILLHSLDKKTYQKMLLINTILWCLLPTFTGRFLERSYLIPFIYLYSIAGYIKIWKDDIKINWKKCFLMAGVIVLLTYSSVVTFDILGTKINYFYIHATQFYGMEKLTTILTALFLFLAFKNININKKFNKFINTIASATFGVYLIHENRLVRKFLWLNILHISKFATSNLLIPYSIFAIFLVFVVCTMIELIRIYLIEKNYMKLVNKLSPIIESKIEKIFDSKLFKKL